jgi:hypothetical protein
MRAPGLALGLEVFGHEAAAVTMARLHAAGDIATEVAELTTHGHSHGLQRLVARAALGYMPAEGFGAPRLYLGEEPDLAVPQGRDLGAVGGPHHVRRVGHDPAVVVLFGAWPGPMRREQGVRAHQPQDPLARDLEPVAHPQPRPDLPFGGVAVHRTPAFSASPLARPRRAGEVGADRLDERGVRDGRL